MGKKVAIMPGDGIGPEVTHEGLRILEMMADQYELGLSVEELPIGGSAYDLAGSPLPEESLAKARSSDAILLGAVGGPKWESIDFALRPEKGLLQLRSELDLFANLRPAQVYGDLADASSLKKEVVEGCDLVVIRELTGGIYFGEPRGITGEPGNRIGHNTLVYSEQEIERIVRVGFEIAGKRNRKLCSVDKANVLEVSVLWREIAEAMAAEFPEIELSHLYVDNAAMQLIRDPRQFDTIVTGNMFGDILSDAAAMITGSIGMLPSASLGKGSGLYEPVHGSAPDIAGKNIANPLASILSVGMMFRYSFNIPEADERIQEAVVEVLNTARTMDIQSSSTHLTGCREMGEMVVNQLARVKSVPAQAAR